MLLHVFCNFLVLSKDDKPDVTLPPVPDDKQPSECLF